jgi:hypothetical protein
MTKGDGRNGGMGKRRKGRNEEGVKGLCLLLKAFHCIRIAVFGFSLW